MTVVQIHQQPTTTLLSEQSVGSSEWAEHKAELGIIWRAFSGKNLNGLADPVIEEKVGAWIVSLSQYPAREVRAACIKLQNDEPDLWINAGHVKKVIIASCAPGNTTPKQTVDLTPSDDRITREKMAEIIKELGAEGCDALKPFLVAAS